MSGTSQKKKPEPKSSKKETSGTSKQVAVKKVSEKSTEVLQVVPKKQDVHNDSSVDGVPEIVQKKTPTKKVTVSKTIVTEMTTPSSSRNIKHGNDLIDDVTASMKRLLGEVKQGTSSAASIKDSAKEKFHLSVLHRYSEFNTILRDVVNERVLWCEPLFPSNAKTVPLNKKLKIASWNTGQTKKTLIEGGLAILMNFLNVDLILVQEIKELKFEDLSGSDKYHIICLPADSSTDTLKRGLFIMYRKELFGSLSNPSGKVGYKTTKQDGAVTKLYKDIEVSSVDVAFKKRANTRIINLYRCGYPNKDSAGHLHTLLEEHLQGDILLLGDGNMENHLTSLTTELKKTKMKNILPTRWDTHYQCKTKNKKKTESYTSPDLIYSNVEKKDVIVHKPIDPRDLLKKFEVFFEERSKKTDSPNEILQSLHSLCESYKNDSKSLEHHYILFVELGNDINKRDLYHCCPPRVENHKNATETETTASSTKNDQTGTSEKKFYCSEEGNDCKFFEKCISE